MTNLKQIMSEVEQMLSLNIQGPHQVKGVSLSRNNQGQVSLRANVVVHVYEDLEPEVPADVYNYRNGNSKF